MTNAVHREPLCVPSAGCGIVNRTVNAKDREISKGIVVNPGRMGGEPCIKGTRIPADMVARMLEGDPPMTPEAILDGYPSLTYHDLTNAKLWARR